MGFSGNFWIGWTVLLLVATAIGAIVFGWWGAVAAVAGAVMIPPALLAIAFAGWMDSGSH